MLQKLLPLGGLILALGLALTSCDKSEPDKPAPIVEDPNPPTIRTDKYYLTLIEGSTPPRYKLTRWYDQSVTQLDLNQYPELRKKVTITDGAFEGLEQLESIIIPEFIEEIGEKTFSGCKSLHNVSIASSVKKLGNIVFDYCTSLERIVIPSTVKEIGSGLFSNCSKLKEVRLPNSITTLPEHTFLGCDALEHIDLPSSIVKIGKETILSCRSLKTITMRSPKVIEIDVYTDIFPFFVKDKPTYYVPKHLVEAYKKDAKWQHMAEYIRPIPGE